MVLEESSHWFAFELLPPDLGLSQAVLSFWHAGSDYYLHSKYIVRFERHNTGYSSGRANPFQS
jgi:hypothetical protein